MGAGDDFVTRSSRKSLKLLGSVGEPINPEAWEWYYHVVGETRCPIVDTWWQTETGGILITPLPGATRLKPGSATQPFFGIIPQIVDAVRNLPFVGPDRMAALEDTYYQAQDAWNTFIYDRTHAPVVTAQVIGANDAPSGSSPLAVNTPTLSPAEQSRIATLEKLGTPMPTSTPAQDSIY